jgi:hypothetical protein
MDGGLLAYYMEKGIGVKSRSKEGVRCQVSGLTIDVLRLHMAEG